MNEPCKHCGEYHSCTDLIDKQADTIAELEKVCKDLIMANEMFANGYKTPQTKLSDEEIWEVIERPELWDDNGVLRSCQDLARAIEAKVRGQS